MQVVGLEYFSDCFVKIVDWVKSNDSAILAGIVSSSIVLLLQTYAVASGNLLFEMLSRRSSLKRFLKFKTPNRIYVVSGKVDKLRSREYDNTVLLAAPDAEAAMKLKATCGLLYLKSEIVGAFSSNLAREIYSENIVSIGGPKNNVVTRVLLDQITSGKIFFENLDIITPKNRYFLEADGENDVVGIDYGIVVFGVNPFNHRNRVLIVAGCDTNGVYSAAKCLEVGSHNQRIFKSIWASKKIKRWGTGTSYFVVKSKTIGLVAGEPEVVEVGYID